MGADGRTYNPTMSRARRVLSLLAALVCLATGAYQATRVPAVRDRTPRWAAALDPLAAAPLQAGRPAALLAAPHRGPAWVDPLLFEAAWDRPDVLWGQFDPRRLPGRQPTVVAIGDIPMPPGYVVVWRRGAVTVLARSRP
jgi:hypothetical protein